jgi:hypothetical protein
VLQPLEVGGGKQRFDGNSLGAIPGELLQIFASELFGGKFFPLVDIGTIRHGILL